MEKAVIPHSILIVNQFGLHASTGERAYKVDGLVLDNNDITQRRSGVVISTIDDFIMTKIQPFQLCEQGIVTYQNLRHER